MRMKHTTDEICSICGKRAPGFIATSDVVLDNKTNYCFKCYVCNKIVCLDCSYLEDTQNPLLSPACPNCGHDLGPVSISKEMKTPSDEELMHAWKKGAEVLEKLAHYRDQQDEELFLRRHKDSFDDLFFKAFDRMIIQSQKNGDNELATFLFNLRRRIYGILDKSDQEK